MQITKKWKKFHLLLSLEPYGACKMADLWDQNTSGLRDPRPQELLKQVSNWKDFRTFVDGPIFKSEELLKKEKGFSEEFLK